MKSRQWMIAAAAAVVTSAGILIALPNLGSGAATGQRVDFNRDIRPIFNQNCTACHGGVRQKNGVSFIYREEALGVGKSGRPTIVPGHPERSELIARLVSRDPEARMPYHASPLPPQQIALLKQWISDGAQWEDHWAFVPPKPQPLPAVKQETWPRSPIDRFILARLETDGLEPSSEARKEELLRRVSFDLIGLPPTVEELSAFLADTAPDAYERQVDRLLASPRYGERWAAMWLDLARYADSRGYTHDTDRPTWPYRDWVIEAFNKNVPYDRFVVAQLAGDLLPDPSYDDRIATSFQRQTGIYDEGGIDNEEYRLVAMMDRVATTWSVLNGVTINCVQCHSHPYDPIRHVEYYKFMAFYNASRDGNLIDDAPTLPVPLDASRRDEAARLEDRRRELLTEVVNPGRALADQSQWSPLAIAAASVNESLGLRRYLAQVEQAQRRGINARAYFAEKRPEKIKTYYEGVIAQATSNLSRAEHSAGTTRLEIENGEVHAIDTIPVQSVLELGTATVQSGLTALRIEVPPQDPGKARHTPDDEFDIEQVDVWSVSPSGQEQEIGFRSFVPDSEENLATTLRTEGAPLKKTDAPMPSLGTGGFSSDIKVFQPRWVIAIPEQPLSLEPGSRLKVQLTHGFEIRGKSAAVRRVKLETSGDPRWIIFAADKDIAAKRAEITDIDHRLAQIPTVQLPVMADEPAYMQHDMLEFERGNFLDKVGPVLAPDMPALFPKLPAGAPRNRLTMANWFFAPGQPLTARVAVNRYWEQLFGTGIVETLEDFGSAGLPPTHPKLLDWLALHFQNDLKWDMKALLRELVTSATYRQSARVTAALLDKDPRNRLLARGPQQRLTAEMVRDQALLASGLLNPEMGGPPAMPPQPGGLWMDRGNGAQWVDSAAPERYRRAVYTYLKRSALYPSLVVFDAADHVVSLPRRIPTDTPLHALVTLNDPVYYEAAQALARRILAEDSIIPEKSASAPAAAGSRLLDERLNHGAQLVLTRDLRPGELTALEVLYGNVRGARSPAISKAAFKSDPDRSRPRVTGEMAALTAVASALFNLDAALTR